MLLFNFANYLLSNQKPLTEQDIHLLCRGITSVLSCLATFIATRRLSSEDLADKLHLNHLILRKITNHRITPVKI